MTTSANWHRSDFSGDKRSNLKRGQLRMKTRFYCSFIAGRSFRDFKTLSRDMSRAFSRQKKEEKDCPEKWGKDVLRMILDLAGMTTTKH
jgi:hypothetical protein